MNRLYSYAQHIEQLLTVVQYQIALQQHKDSQNLDLSSFMSPPDRDLRQQLATQQFYEYEYFRRRRKRSLQDNRIEDEIEQEGVIANVSKNACWYRQGAVHFNCL